MGTGPVVLEPVVTADFTVQNGFSIRLVMGRIAAMIYVVAEIELVDNVRDKFLAHFQANVPNVLAEEGCLEYAPTCDLPTDLAAQPPARDNYVTVVEKWETLASLQAHLVAPHMTEFRQHVKGLVVKSTLRVLQPER